MTVDSVSVSSAPREMRDALVGRTGTPVVFDSVRARGPEGIKFDVWYCNMHLPALAGEYSNVPLRRYAAPSRSSYIVIGELDDMPRDAGSRDANPLPAMAEHGTRFIGHPLSTQRRRDVGDEVLDAAVVYPAFLRVPQDRMQEVGRWYDEEHLPMLLSCPQWVMTRRFRIAGAHGTDYSHVALHYLTDLRALQSPARDMARDTPWRDKLIAEGWFVPEYWICYRLQDF